MTHLDYQPKTDANRVWRERDAQSIRSRSLLFFSLFLIWQMICPSLLEFSTTLYYLMTLAVGGLYLFYLSRGCVRIRLIKKSVRHQGVSQSFVDVVAVIAITTVILLFQLTYVVYWYSKEVGPLRFP